MPTLRLELQIRDFDLWRSAFARDFGQRRQSGMRRYRIARPLDDPNYVMIDADFDGAGEIESYLAKMREVWQSRESAPALVGSPRVRILETVEVKEY